MNTRKFKQILQENLMSSVESLELPSDYIFLKDNDPKHTAKSLKKWLSENNINVLLWPSQSPYLYPIKNFFENSNPKNNTNLKTICQWYKISTNYCKKLIENYRKKLVAVEVNK